MHDTMLTYSQWERRFKRALKKTIRKKLANVMWGILTISVFMLPFWMVMDDIKRTLNLSDHLMLKRIKERAEAQKV